MFTAGAHDLHIASSTLTLAGGDINHNHNVHYHCERKRDIWAILQAVPNFRDIYHSMLEKATPGTGMWLVKGDKFRVWLEHNGNIKIFWGSGIPGAGKTVLASLVIEHLEDLRYESGGAICVCYVYFRYSDITETTVHDVLAILVRQTFERHPECRVLIENAYTQHLEEGSEPTLAQLLGLLRELANRMACTFYVLDALDEAPTKIQLAVVKTLASLDVKLFITSRPLENLQVKFPQAYTFTIMAQGADLDLHISKGIDESPDLQKLLDQEDPSLKQEIVSTIKKNCGGMFLHASLQLDALCECISARAVSRTLKGFPSRIEDVYLRTWDRILRQNAEHVSLAKDVLVWVLNASRSMTMEELGRAVATSPDTHKFQADRLVPSTTLISLCHGLVTVEEDSRRVRLVRELASNPSTLILIHPPSDYTAKNTLERLLRESFPHPHSLLAAVCMTHLTECGFQSTSITSYDEFRIALDEDPLLAYASEAWAFHTCAGLNEEETRHRAAQFIKECHAFPAFAPWYFDILTPLHIVGLYKLPMAFIKGVITGNPNLKTRMHKQTPLMVASRSGDEGLVAHLIALPETQVNLVDNFGWSALMWATDGGREGVVKLLLTHPGIQVNLVSDKRWSALIQAACVGNEGIVKLLLAYPGIEVNVRDNNYWSALAWATIGGHEGVARLLLAHPGIEVNSVDENGSSALRRADYPGLEGVTDFNIGGWTPLMTATRMGQEGIVKLLPVYPQIQIDSLNDHGTSVLMLAAATGQEGLVKLLLTHPEIQVNATDDNGWSALVMATIGGHEGVVKLLLAYPGIQVDSLDENGVSPLMQAIATGQEGIVKLLLAYPGIQVNQEDDNGWPPLMAAALMGQGGIVKLLLAHPRIQANFVKSGGWSALIAAASAGDEGIVKLLLTYPGIDVNSVNNNGWSALMQAASNGYEGIVNLLLMHPGIQLHQVDNHGSTALLLAAQNGHNAVVELLLTTGAFDINAFDNDRHSVIVELLRDFEARRTVTVATPEIAQLSLHDRTDEESSDCDSDEAYHDAEEGSEVDISLGPSIIV